MESLIGTLERTALNKTHNQIAKPQAASDSMDGREHAESQLSAPATSADLNLLSGLMPSRDFHFSLWLFSL